MKLDLRKAVTANWPIKGTALALATLLWAAVAAQEPTTQLVPVTLNVEVPPGRALTQAPAEVQALVQGRAGEMFKLYTSLPIVTKRIPETRASSYTLTLSVQDLNFVEDVSVVVQDIRPREIEVYLDTLAERWVPIELRAVVVPEDGFELVGGVRADPDSVLISGPRSLVRDVVSIPTMPDTIFRTAASIFRLIELDTTNLRVIVPSRHDVNLIAEITQISTRVLSNVPVAIDGAWEVDEPTVLVTVEGPTRRIEQLTVDSITVTARPSGDANPARVRLSIRAPLGIAAWATPDSATVRRPPGA